jgi:hypothetical protein
MPLDFGDIRALVDSGDFTKLIGEIEGQQLDVKSLPYQFHTGSDAKREFAKDVAAFANVNGGCIIIGAETTVSPLQAGEQITAIKPFSGTLFSPNQYGKLLDEWLYPQPSGIIINWYPDENNSTNGIGLIFIPAQDPASKPFLITRTPWIAEDDLSTSGRSTEVDSQVYRKVPFMAQATVDVSWLTRRTLTVVLWAAITPIFAQSPPLSPDRPWHSPEERQVIRDAERLRLPTVSIEPDRVYSLAELIDLAEAHNPETRVAWESARAQAATLGIARSELLPTLAAVALAGVDRDEAGLGSQFYRQTAPSIQISLTLNYTIFDFGARRGRIDEASARLLASNFGFNDVHRQLIYDVSGAYYRLLNAAGQEEAAGASLVNAQNVQEAAEERGDEALD